MSKQNNHRLKAAPSMRKEPRYLFNLDTEDGLAHVRCFALSSGLQMAVEQKKAGLDLSKDAIEAGVIETALKYERLKYQGKCGTNKPVEYRQLFTKLATRMYTAMVDYLEKEPAAYQKLAALTPAQLNYHALFTAERYQAQIAALPDDEPITMNCF